MPIKNEQFGKLKNKPNRRLLFRMLPFWMIQTYPNKYVYRMGIIGIEFTGKSIWNDMKNGAITIMD